MKSVVITASLALAILGLSAADAAALRCSERNQVCLRFCETNFKKAPGCTSQCADAVPRCMQDGCWITRMTNKCGYTKG